MNRKRIMQALYLIFPALILLGIFIYLFFPLNGFNSSLSRALAEQGLTLTPTAKKTVLPGVAWEKPVLSSEQGALLEMRRLSMQLKLLPLLLGKVRCKAAAGIGNGRLDMQIGLNGSEAFSISSDGVNISDIPFFRTVLKAKAAGMIWSQGTLVRNAKGLQGEIKLEIKKLEYSGLKLGSFALPDVSGLTNQGIVRFVDGNARLESFTLQGEGVYMRLSGNLPGGANAFNTPLDLVLEIMPKPEFMENQKVVFMVMAKFMVSPGNYRIPIRGTLLKPEIL
jgi:type II secretion system protein N